MIIIKDYLSILIYALVSENWTARFIGKIGEVGVIGGSTGAGGGGGGEGFDFVISLSSFLSASNLSLF